MLITILSLYCRQIKYYDESKLMAIGPKGASKAFESNSYRPLPLYLTIKDSGIDGLGLFASEDIAAGTYAGETHFKINENQDWLRTPLGGFVNHAEQPNAKINLVADGVRALTIEKAIKKGEEVTVFYTLY